MATTTSIEWTQGPDGTPGKTWNPVVGCTRVSPGCDNCYARWLRRSSDDGWVPAWVDDSPAACPANPAETAADGPQAARDGLVRGMHGPAPS